MLLKRSVLWLLCIVVAVAAQAAQQRFILLHTNDVHASFVPHEATWVRTSPKPLIGGFVRLQQAVDSIRRAGGANLLLDAGDVMTGNPVSDIEYHGAQGGALFEMMNRIGYAAWCPGNHDLDISQDNLLGLTRIAGFPTLCANLVDDRGGYPLNNRPYAVFERDGIRIGVIGIMSQELSSLVLQQNLQGLRVLSPAETAQRFIDELRPKVDLVVLLTHQGADRDSALAREIHGADVIVGGHSHTRLRVPSRVNNVIIVQTGSNCENLGVLEITLQDRKPVDYRGSLIPLWPEEGKPAGTVASLVDSVKTEVDRRYNQVIGKLTEDWLRQSPDNPLGVYVTEAQREAAHADVAFMNVHGVRKDLTAGPVTRRDLYEVLPFRNVIVTFQLTGEDLTSVLRYYLGRHPAILMTGIEAAWAEGKDGAVEFRSVRVGGKPLDPAKEYVCAATDYFVGEAAHYIGREITNASYSRTTLYGVLEEMIRKEGTLQRKPPARIARVQ